MAPSRKLAELFYELRARTSGLEKDLKAAETGFGKLSAFVLSNPVAAITAVGTAALGVGVKAAQMAAEVEKSLRRIGSLSGTEGIEKLRDSIANLSKATGKSQADLAGFAEQIARLGAESSEGVAARLRAAVTASAATGEDLGRVIEGLDQTLDQFGGTSEDASRALGTLFAAAKGRTSLSDLFANLQAASPAISKLGLSLDVAARALVALGEQGKNAKQAASALKDLAAQGEEGRKKIVALADTMPAVGQGFADMAKAANDANRSVTNLGALIKEELNATLIDLGNRILPSVTAALKLLGLGASQANLGKALAIDAQNDLDDLKRSLFRVASDAKAGRVALKDLGDVDLRNLVANLALVQAAIKDTKGAEVFRQSLAGLLAEIEKIQKARIDAPDLVSPVSPKTKAELDAERKAAEAAAKAFDTLRDAIRDLGTFHDALAGRTALSEKEMVAFKDRIDETAKAANLTKAQIAAFKDEIDKLRTATKLAEVDQARRDFDALFATFTTTAVDDLRAKLNELKADMDKRLVPPDVQKRVIDLEKSLISLTATLEALQKKQEVAAKLGPIQEIGAIFAEQEQLQTRLLSMDQTGAKFDREREAIKARIVVLDARIVDLQEENKKKTADVTKSTASFALQLASAAEVAFALVSALAGSNSQAAQLVGATAHIAENIANLADLAKAAGGLGKLFSTGAGLASAIPAIAGTVASLAGILATLFGPNPEAEAQKRIIAEQIAALDRLSKNIGDLADSDVTGSQLGSARAKLAGFTPALLEQIGNAPIEAQSSIIQSVLKGLGLSLEDLKEVADALGIPLDLSTEGIINLKKAIDDADLAAFTNTFAGQLKKLAIEFEVLQVKDPAEKLKRFIDVLTSDVGAGGLFGALKDISLGDQGGRDAARELIQKIFEQLASGDFDPEALGGLSLQQALDAITRLSQELAAIDDAARATFQAALKAAQEKARAEREAAEAKRTADEQAAEEARAARVKAAEEAARAKIAFEDLTGTDALKVLADAFGELSPAIAGLLDGLDLTKAEDVETLDQRIRELFANLSTLTPEQLGTLTIEELLGALGDLEGGLDGFLGGLTKVTDGVLTLSDRLNEASTDLGFSLLGITDPLERAVQTVAALGKLAPGLSSITGGLNIADPTARRAAIEALKALGQSTTDEALRDAARDIINALLGIPDAVSEGVTDAVSTGDGGSITSTGLDNLTERTGVRIEELLGAMYRVELKQLDALLAGLTTSSGARIVAPSFAPGTSASFTTTTTHVTINNQFPNVVDAPTAREAGAGFSDEFVRGLSRRIGIVQESDRAREGRFRGGA